MEGMEDTAEMLGLFAITTIITITEKLAAGRQVGLCDRDHESGKEKSLPAPEGLLLHVSAGIPKSAHVASDRMRIFPGSCFLCSREDVTTSPVVSDLLPGGHVTLCVTVM